MKKAIRLENCTVHVESGTRSGKPVVACALNFGSGSTVHFLQIDLPMQYAIAADQYVKEVDEATGQQIYADIMATDGHILEAVNNVFGASTQQAAARYELLVKRQGKR